MTEILPIETNSFETRIQYLLADFEAAWRGSLSAPPGNGKGNYLYVLLSMLLMELACRTCAAAKNDENLLQKFADQLDIQDSRYLNTIPAYHHRQGGYFSLPSRVPKQQGNTVLAFLFAYVRNGLAHSYSPIPLTLKNNTILDIAIGGIIEEIPTKECDSIQRTANHLSLIKEQNGHSMFIVHPGLLYFDFKTAIINSGIASISQANIPSLNRLKCTYSDLKKAIDPEGREYLK